GGPAVTRAGFVSLAGRPNVGKSTLLNRLVGEKVAIVSNRPQTTRRAIRGVATGEDWQLVVVDLPGVQRPRDPLTERMQRRLEPEGPRLCPREEHTDVPGRVRVAEVIREQVLARTREELPHAVEVEVEEIGERADGLLVVEARVWAETESQKAILVGAGGRMV